MRFGYQTTQFDFYLFHSRKYQAEEEVWTVEGVGEEEVEGDLQFVLSVGVQEVEVEVAKVVEATT